MTSMFSLLLIFALAGVFWLVLGGFRASEGAPVATSSAPRAASRTPSPPPPPPAPPPGPPQPRSAVSRSVAVEIGRSTADEWSPPTHVGHHAHVATLRGRRVVSFAPEYLGDVWVGSIDDPKGTSYFFGTTSDDQLTDEPAGALFYRWDAALADPRFDEVESLIFGAWTWEVHDEPPAPVYAALIARAPQLTRLEDLFIGEALQEESEISWLVIGDVGPVLSALPALRHAWVRGVYEISSLRSASLTHLTLQTGGMPKAALDALLAAELPALRQLTIWLGDEGYGREVEAEALPALLDRFPALEHLGLQNADIQDEVIEAVLAHPGIARLQSLDFSMGATTDRGARAILACPAVRGLKHLNLRHHFIGDDALIAALQHLPCRIDLSDRLEPDDGYLYPEVSE
jgi:hypothetical protein